MTPAPLSVGVDPLVGRWHLKVSVELTIEDWLNLLLELEHAQRFINRDTDCAVYLYEKIKSQLR